MSAPHDRVALVTGSASGIGAAVAVTFADLGARVAVNSVTSVAEGEQLAATNGTSVESTDSAATPATIATAAVTASFHSVEARRHPCPQEPEPARLSASIRASWASSTAYSASSTAQ